jgi:hypothetical protein
LVPGYPRDLEAIVLRAMAPDAEDRHPTAEALQLELEAFVRANRLDVSSAALAGLMRSVFGEEPYPSVPTSIGSGVALVDTEVDVRPLADSTPQQPRRSVGWILLGVTLAIGVGGTAAWAFGVLPQRDAAPREEPAVAAPVEVDAVREPAPRESDAMPPEPTPAPTPDPSPTPNIEPSPAEPEAQPVEDETDRPSAKRKRPRRTGKSKKADERRQGPAGMYP